MKPFKLIVGLCFLIATAHAEPPSLRYVKTIEGRNTGQEGLLAVPLDSQIYAATQGYPRRIAILCHDALERLVMDHQPTVTGALIQSLVGRERALHATPILA